MALTIRRFVIFHVGRNKRQNKRLQDGLHRLWLLIYEQYRRRIFNTGRSIVMSLHVNRICRSKQNQLKRPDDCAVPPRISIWKTARSGRTDNTIIKEEKASIKQREGDGEQWERCSRRSFMLRNRSIASCTATRSGVPAPAAPTSWIISSHDALPAPPAHWSPIRRQVTFDSRGLWERIDLCCSTMQEQEISC